MGGSKRSDNRRAKAGEAGRRPHMGVLEARDLVRLEDAQGEEAVRRKIGPGRFKQYQEWVAALQRMAEEEAPMMEAIARSATDASRAMSPLVRSLSRTAVAIAAARQGDREAILRLLRWNPLFALNDTEIAVRIEEIADLRTDRDRRFLDKVVDEIRIGLLKPRRPGRPRVLDPDKATVVLAIQAKFDQLPRLKANFRNPAAHSLAIEDRASQISEDVPQDLRDEVAAAVKAVLLESPGTREQFGVKVAAKVFGCSIPSIRAALKRMS